MEQMDNLEYACFWANDIADLSPLESLPRKDDVHNKEQFIEIGDIITVQR